MPVVGDYNSFSSAYSAFSNYEFSQWGYSNLIISNAGGFIDVIDIGSSSHRSWGFPPGDAPAGVENFAVVDGNLLDENGNVLLYSSENLNELLIDGFNDPLNLLKLNDYFKDLVSGSADLANFELDNLKSFMDEHFENGSQWAEDHKNLMVVGASLGFYGASSSAVAGIGATVSLPFVASTLGILALGGAIYYGGQKLYESGAVSDVKKYVSALGGVSANMYAKVGVEVSEFADLVLKGTSTAYNWATDGLNVPVSTLTKPKGTTQDMYDSAEQFYSTMDYVNSAAQADRDYGKIQTLGATGAVGTIPAAQKNNEPYFYDTTSSNNSAYDDYAKSAEQADLDNANTEALQGQAEALQGQTDILTQMLAVFAGLFTPAMVENLQVVTEKNKDLLTDSYVNALQATKEAEQTVREKQKADWTSEVISNGATLDKVGRNKKEWIAQYSETAVGSYVDSEGQSNSIKQGYKQNILGSKVFEKSIEQHNNVLADNQSNIDFGENYNVELNKVDTKEDRDNTGVLGVETPEELTDYQIHVDVAESMFSIEAPEEQDIDLQE